MKDELVAEVMEEPVQPFCPVLHAHRNMPLCLKFGIIQIEGHDSFQSSRLGTAGSHQRREITQRNCR